MRLPGSTRHSAAAGFELATTIFDCKVLQIRNKDKDTTRSYELELELIQAQALMAQKPYTTALTHAPSHLTERATHAHPLHPAALASVPSGKVLVRVRVRTEARASGRSGTEVGARALRNRTGGGRGVWGRASSAACGVARTNVCVGPSKPETTAKGTNNAAPFMTQFSSMVR